MPSGLSFNLGRKAYSEALDFQRRLVSQKQKEELPELLLLLEHNHVITFGREGKDENLLSDPKSLEQAGVETHYIERGGDVTYHGPGQLVVYPIFDLRHWEKDVHLFLRNLEEVIIRTLGHYNLPAQRVHGLTGVWVEGKKIAAIGVAAKKWITFHGLALNVNTDLSYFRFIHPCGLIDKPVTSMQQLLGRQADFNEVAAIMTEEFAKVFGLEVKSGSQEFLNELASEFRIASL